MTHQLDVVRGRDTVARWCDLAEQRLEYLTELFETGRWRRFHSELALLENIQEAKTALETWRNLERREASLDNSAVDLSWLGRNAATPLLGKRRQVDRLPPPPVEIPSEPPPSEVSIVPEADRFCSNEALAAPVSAAPAAATPLPGKRRQVDRLPPQPVEIPSEPPPSEVSIVPEADRFCSNEALAAPVSAAPAAPDSEAPAEATPLDDIPALTPSLAAAILERYPQLRNAL